MFTGISLLSFSLFSVSSAAVCSSVVGSTGLYSPGFISRSGSTKRSLHTCFSLACTSCAGVCLVVLCILQPGS